MGFARGPGRALLAVAAVVLFAGSAAADGLGKFEQLVKPTIPPGALSYKSAKALGDNGFVLDDVVLTPPPDGGAQPKPVHIKSITVDDADFASIEKKAPPNFLKLRIEGIEVPPDPAAGINLKEMAGIDKVTADLRLDYRLDPDKKTFTLSQFALDLHGLGQLDLSMVLDGVTPADVGSPDKAVANTTLRTASLVFDDHSLLAKVLPMAAKMQGSDADALIQMAKGTLVGMRAGQGPKTQAIIDALASYVEDYKAPKGPLKLSFAPPDKVTVATITAAGSPEDAVKALGLTVDYAGTRKQEAAAPPAATEKPAAGGRGASCTVGARLFVWHEDGWAAATVREPPKADQCLVRLDGGGPDDDVTVPTGRLLAWSIDGPGKAVTECRAGATVVVENDGEWYPAKITDNPAAAGKCAIKFTGEDGDAETVSLKRVRSLD